MSDGPWLVSVREVRQALERYATATPRLRAELESDALWRDWLSWLRETAEHGGSTVT